VGLVRSCQDLSEGGLAVAAAEMAFAGGIGATLSWPGGFHEACLFAETPTRFLLEVRQQHVDQFLKVMGKVPNTEVGNTVQEPRLRIDGAPFTDFVISLSLQELKDAWQKPLAW